MALQDRFVALLLYLWFAFFRPQDWIWFDITNLRLSLVLGGILVVPAIVSGVWPNLSHPLSIGTAVFLSLGVGGTDRCGRPGNRVVLGRLLCPSGPRVLVDRVAYDHAPAPDSGAGRRLWIAGLLRREGRPFVGDRRWCPLCGGLVGRLFRQQRLRPRNGDDHADAAGGWIQRRRAVRGPMVMAERLGKARLPSGCASVCPDGHQHLLSRRVPRHGCRNRYIRGAAPPSCRPVSRPRSDTGDSA